MPSAPGLQPASAAAQAASLHQPDV